MSSRLRALRVVHPFPSLLNAGLVLGLAAIAGGSVSTVAALTVAMLGIQFCIGAVNDIADVRLDERTKPWKPIPAGLVTMPTARSIAIATGAAALLAALTQGLLVTAMTGVMLGCGLLYDLRLKPTAWAWLCFSVAFSILPIYAWYGAVQQLPPLAQFVIPLAALAGPALQLSNGIVDLERDEAGGITTLATGLGRRRSLAVIALLLAVIYTVAWITLVPGGPLISRAVVVVATGVAVLGVVLSAARSPSARGAGWTAQAVAIALLALGWLGAI